MTNAYKIEFGFGTGKDRNQQPISAMDFHRGLTTIKRFAVKAWGGYTLTSTNGGWVNPAGLLVEEPGMTLMVCTKHSGSVVIAAMVDEIKKALRQEAVCVTQTPVNFQII